MGFHVDIGEFTSALSALKKSTTKMNSGLSQSKSALNGIIQTNAVQGATGKAINNMINNYLNAAAVALFDANVELTGAMEQTLQDFQTTVGETDAHAILDEDTLNRLSQRLSSFQSDFHEENSKIAHIYHSIDDLVSLACQSV